MFDDFLHMSRTFPTTGDLKILSWRWWCFLHLHHGCHLGDVVHDELGGDCLPCPRLPRDDHTLVFTVWKLAILCLMILAINIFLIIIKDYWSSRIIDHQGLQTYRHVPVHVIGQCVNMRRVFICCLRSAHSNISSGSYIYPCWISEQEALTAPWYMSTSLLVKYFISCNIEELFFISSFCTLCTGLGGNQWGKVCWQL